MTEASYQEGRKFMQKVNHLRGKITEQKGQVAKWTKIESSFRENFKPTNADGAKKMLDKAMVKLTEYREKFAAMKFPDSDITEKVYRCIECGAKVPNSDVICDTCALT
jgi:cell fate (sporulation/competence/biofilm development) regulator YmcA (YheA/YmcA/DUF963 family)